MHTVASIEKFEDIEAWQKTRQLTKLIYQITSNGLWAKDFGLRDQIRRASVSAMSNIAEGFARKGDIEFARFLSISRASLAEVKSQMYVGLDLGYVDQSTFADICKLTDSSAGLISGLMRYLKK